MYRAGAESVKIGFMKGEKKSRQSNASLSKARAAKNDEFYTRRESIEAELQHYFPHFRGKVVYCNCDDPKISEFYKYFKAQFHFLGLRRLFTTCYKNRNPDIFTRYDSETAVSVEYDGVETHLNFLQSDGDFRNPECIDLLRQADIVCTNPPFSLFREYVVQLAESGKKFLVLGSVGAVIYKEIFRLIMAGKLWLGNKPMGVDMLFNVPPDFAKWLRENKKEGSGYRLVDGEVLGRSPAIWFTNLPHKKREESLILTERYSESAYPKYDNYDAINVNKVADIPRDYAGVMGVPISFLDKWNPAQFELLGNNRWHDGSWESNDINVVNGRKTYMRLLIRNRNPK